MMVSLSVVCLMYDGIIVDGSAIVWDVNTGAQLLKYVGHVGSGEYHMTAIQLIISIIVNCIAFHPKEPLACTGTLYIFSNNTNFIIHSSVR